MNRLRIQLDKHFTGHAQRLIRLTARAASSTGGLAKKTVLIQAAIRSHLKNRILAQGQGGGDVQPAGILMYSEELKRDPNIEIGPKDFFEMASNNSARLP